MSVRPSLCDCLSRSFRSNLEHLYACMQGTSIFILSTLSQSSTHLLSQHGQSPSALQMNSTLTRPPLHQPASLLDPHLINTHRFPSAAQSPPTPHPASHPEDKLLVQIKRSPIPPIPPPGLPFLAGKPALPFAELPQTTLEHRLRNTQTPAAPSDV